MLIAYSEKNGFDAVQGVDDYYLCTVRATRTYNHPNYLIFSVTPLLSVIHIIFLTDFFLYFLDFIFFHF